jgi:hypothetical protein
MQQAKDVEEAIKKRFIFPKERSSNNREHFIVSSEELKKFVISYCGVMNYGYKELLDKQLKLYNDSV